MQIQSTSAWQKKTQLHKCQAVVLLPSVIESWQRLRSRLGVRKGACNLTYGRQSKQYHLVQHTCLAFADQLDIHGEESEEWSPE
jgi:hypothetical protein